MKKLLSLFSALALTLPLFAGIVTFKPGDFAGQGTASTGSTVTVTKNGVTVTCDKAYGASSALRCYKNAVFSISSESKISTIDFAFEATNYNGGLDASVTVDGLTWSQTLTSQGRFTEIKVSIAADVEEEKVDTISVSQALARLNESKTGECYIKGKVSQILSSGVETYGNISYWLHDIDTPNDSIQAYRMKAADNKSYTSSADIEFVVGDDILVYATGLAIYHNNSTGADIPETTGGYYVRTISGKPNTTLNWTYGKAIRFDEYWQLEIAMEKGSETNVLIMQFTSDKDNAIGGHHDLTTSSTISINGSSATITDGFVKLTYKEVAGTGNNVYTTEISAITDANVYTISADIEFNAVNNKSLELDGDRPFIPTEGQVITCDQARSYALSLPHNTEGEITFTVEGYVTDLLSDGQTFWMDDAQGSKKTFEIFKLKSLSPIGILLKKDAVVRATGKAKCYSGTPEMVNAQVEVIYGGENITGEETVNVAGAVAIAQALDANKTTTKYYDIIGYVSEIVYPYSEEKGITFWMSDNANDGAQTFEVYQVQCSPETAAMIVEGVKVRVTARITHFHQDAQPATETSEAKPERNIYETAKGGIVALASDPIIINPTEDYYIIYRDKDYGILNTVEISLELPDAPIIGGFTFLKWVVVAGDLLMGINIQAVYQYNGDATSAPEVVSVPNNKAQRLIRNGNLYILSEEKIYTAQGQEVK